MSQNEGNWRELLVALADTVMDGEDTLDSPGEEYVMGNDEAVAPISGFVRWARELCEGLGMAPSSGLSDPREADQVLEAGAA